MANDVLPRVKLSFPYAFVSISSGPCQWLQNLTELESLWNSGQCRWVFIFFLCFFRIDTKTKKPIFIDLVGSLIMFQDYLIDAPESVGDGFSVSGGAILFSFQYPLVTVPLWLKFVKFF